MLDNETVEFLIKTANTVAMKEKEYKQEKQNLEILRAQYILQNDWEALIGKKKPTVQEKDSYIKIAVEEQERKLNDLKIQRDYCRRVFEIHMLAHKE